MAGAGLLRTFGDVLESGGAAQPAFVSAAGHVALAVPDEVRVYALDADAPVARHRFDDARVARICPGPHSRVVLIGCDDGRVLSWDSVAGRLTTLREPDGQRIRALAHAAAVPRFACATDSAIECRSAEDGRLVGRIDQALGGGRLHFQAPPLMLSDDGEGVFFASAETPAVLAWRPDEGTATPLIDVAGSGPVVAIAEDGGIVLTAPADRELAAIATATGERIAHVRNSREFSCLALACDARTVATGDYEHDVKLWDLMRADAGPVAWRERGHIEKVALCDDAGYAFVASENVREIWNVATGGPVGIDGTPRSGTAGDGTWREASERRGQPLLDPWMQRQIREQLTEALGGPADDSFSHERPVGPLAFSHDAGRAVSAPYFMAKFADTEEAPHVAGETPDYPLRLWDFDDISEPRLLHGHTSPITCADMTRDGTRALTGSWGRLLRLWDLESGTCLRVLRGHRGIVFACALTDDARVAITGSEDMSVRLWDLVEGRLLFTFATSSAVTGCDIARDGSVVVAGEASGRVHIFEVR